MTPVRVGVIGLGGFGRQHAQTLAGISEADLVALVARRQASLDLAHERLPGVPGYLDLDEAIRTSGAEAWVVATTTPSHVEITRRLLEAGSIVLLEKPLSSSSEEAESLADVVRADSSNLMLGHIVLFNSEFLALQDEVRVRPPLRFMDWVRHRPTSRLRQFPGENPMHLTMVHDLYATQALVQSADPIRVEAQVHHNAEGAVDLVQAHLTFPGNLLASFTAAFMSPDGGPANGYDRAEFFGDGWWARMSMNPRPIELCDDQARWPLSLEIRAHPTAPTGMMASELRCFCRVVRGVEEVPAGARYQDALQVQRWMTRIEQAYSG